MKDFPKDWPKDWPRTLGVPGGFAGISFPITINFDGDEPTYFDGGWAEAGGNVTNDQISFDSSVIDGALLNGDMEAGDPPTGWQSNGTPTTFESSGVQVHSGLASAHLVTDATTEGIRRTITPPNGSWIEWGTWFYPSIGTDYRLRDTGLATNNTDVTLGLGSFQQIIKTDRTILASHSVRLVVIDAAGEFYIDDVTFKIFTFASLLNALKGAFGLADGFYIDVYINAITDNTQTGVLWNYDGANNFGMAYFSHGNLVVDKNVAGTYSNLASVAQAVTPDQILRIENATGSNVLDILYNGVSKATPTIADAGIISNTGIALFSTEAANAISKVEIGLL